MAKAANGNGQRSNGNGQRLVMIFLTALLGAVTLFGGIGFSHNHGDHKDMRKRISTGEVFDAGLDARFTAMEKTLGEIKTLLERN